MSFQQQSNDRRVLIPSNDNLNYQSIERNHSQTNRLSSFESHPPTVISSLKKILFISKFNILLVFIPIGIISGILHWSSTTTFILNFIAIIPLAKLLSISTEEVSLKLGQTIGGLLNATFGNAVELIISIAALRNGLTRVVQASLLGSILSNLLLVLGFCFLLGGTRYFEQKFNVTVAQTSSSLFGLVIISFLIPAAFHSAVGSSGIIKEDILKLSYGTAIILLIIYILFLIFQLKTHSSLFQDSNDDNEEESKLLLSVSIFMLVFITILVATCAEFMVDSIEGLTETFNLSKTFVGLILLPIVGNAAEHVTAVTAAMKDKMDLSITVALGSSMQIALLITPLMVILGWIIGQPLSLDFQTFETAVLFVSVLIVNYLIMDGKSNWLEGAMLIASYLIISIAFFYFPDPKV